LTPPLQAAVRHATHPDKDWTCMHCEIPARIRYLRRLLLSHMEQEELDMLVKKEVLDDVNNTHAAPPAPDTPDDEDDDDDAGPPAEPAEPAAAPAAPLRELATAAASTAGVEAATDERGAAAGDHGSPSQPPPLETPSPEEGLALMAAASAAMEEIMVSKSPLRTSPRRVSAAVKRATPVVAAPVQSKRPRRQSRK
jgi:hypothetical protein